MEIVNKEPTTKVGGAKFTGDVWVDAVARGVSDNPLRVSIVRFAPGARNAWHCHLNGQTLHVTDGVGRVQQRGGGILEVRAGDTIWTPPGEWHWHGAAPDHFMTHLSIVEGAGDGVPDSQWGEAVGDEDYLGPAHGR